MIIEKKHVTSTSQIGMLSSHMRRVWWVAQWIATQVTYGQHLFSK